MILSNKISCMPKTTNIVCIEGLYSLHSSENLSPENLELGEKKCKTSFKCTKPHFHVSDMFLLCIFYN